MALRAAGLVVFRRLADGVEYLLMQASYGENHWSPPKGHVDYGETDKEAALRETKEEAGLSPAHFHIIDFQKELQYEVLGRPKTVVYFLAEMLYPDTPITLSEEHQDYRWLSIESACVLVRYPDLQEALLACQKYLEDAVEIQ